MIGIFRAANGSMLPLFLLANVLTGGVNVGMDTLAMGDWAARAFVVAYALTLCCAACLATLRQRPPAAAAGQRSKAAG